MSSFLFLWCILPTDLVIDSLSFFLSSSVYFLIFGCSVFFGCALLCSGLFSRNCSSNLVRNICVGDSNFVRYKICWWLSRKSSFLFSTEFLHSLYWFFFCYFHSFVVITASRTVFFLFIILYVLCLINSMIYFIPRVFSKIVLSTRSLSELLL